MREIQMTIPDTHFGHTGVRGEPKSHTILERGHRLVVGRRAHTAKRKRARLTSARNRRTIARWLGRAAKHDHEPHPFARRRETLLHDRVAAVRADLLEITAMLECAPDPDRASIAALRDLLADGCDSPLYNSDVHMSELIATLHYIRAGLCAPQASLVNDSLPELPH
jgi:hypothetical protein